MKEIHHVQVSPAIMSDIRSPESHLELFRSVMRLFVLFLLVFLFACNERLPLDGGGEYVHDEETLVKGINGFLKGEKIVEGRELFTAFNLLYSANRLIVCRGIPNPTYYSVFDLNTRSFVSNFGVEGGGPGEFVGVIRSSIDKRSGSLAIFSRSTGNEYFEYNIDSAILNSDYRTKPRVKFEELGVNRVVKDFKGNFAMIALHSSERLIMLDSTGSKTGGYFDYPFEDEMNDLRVEVFGMAYQSHLVLSTDAKKVAIFSMSSPNWDIVSLEGEEPELINRTHLRSLKFFDDSHISKTSSSFSVVKSTDNKNAFVDVKAVGDHIYALYSGKSISEVGYDADFADVLLKLDWSGKLIKKFKLDRPTKTFCVDEDEERLYSIVEEEQRSYILEYSF